MNQNFENYEDLLPDGAIAMNGIRILAYLNKHGTICYKFKHAGDVAVTQVIGLLEMVKTDILNIALDTGRDRARGESED